MKLYRIYGLLIRHYFSFLHNFDRVSDVFYWPTVDLLVWGLMSSYVQKINMSGINIIFIIVSGLIFWTIVWRMPYEVSIALLDDMWSKNLINIFVSPLTFIEWFASLIIMSLVKGFLSFIWCGILAFLLYKVGVLSLGLAVIPFIFLLMLNGWTLGIIISAIILRYGMKVQAFGWTLGAIIMPFSAMYYPVSILPSWAQLTSRFVPASYVFESIRQLAIHGTININAILISLSLNAFYLSIAVFSIWRSYKGMLNRGVSSYY